MWFLSFAFSLCDTTKSLIPIKQKIVSCCTLQTMGTRLPTQWLCFGGQAMRLEKPECTMSLCAYVVYFLSVFCVPVYRSDGLRGQAMCCLYKKARHFDVSMRYALIFRNAKNLCVTFI